MARDTFSVPILHIYSSVGYCVVYFCLGFVRAFYQINEIDSTLSFYIYLSYKESDDIIQFVMLTLHAAIATVLEIHRVPLCAKELADEINRRRLYIRRDRTLLRSSQIHARVKNYPALFEKSGGVITLKK